MSTIRRLREEDELTDIAFQAEGEQTAAHKIILAAASEKWKSQFAGSWGRQLEHKAVVTVDMDFKTLSAVVDFAYTGIYQGPQVSVSTPRDEITNIVDETLDLLTAADEYLMPRLFNKVEAYMAANTTCLIRDWTVSAMLQRTANANATWLHQQCKKYSQKNKWAVEQYENETAE